MAYSESKTWQYDADRIVGCETCGKGFTPKNVQQRSCTQKCRKDAKQAAAAPAVDLSTGSRGAAVELWLSARLMLEGWSVYRSLSPNSSVDMIACKDGITRFIECRAARRGTSTLYFGKEINEGYPRPTEIAACIPAENFVAYFPV